ncbi:MAG TPA: iron-containing alcohol dehydrogenase [Gaiellales bacterium]
MIDPFSFHLPVKIRFGEGAIAALADVLEELDASAPTVVVEAPVAAIPGVAEAIAGLDVYEKPPGEPTVALVDAMVARMQARPPDVIVAIGGGSALDLAKAARVAHSQGTPFARLLAGAEPVAEPLIGLVAVPTTSGTGSEVSGGAVVVDHETGRKLGVASPLMRAQHALVDPLLTLGLPPAATMGTGADALAQAIGGVIVRNGNPGSVALGLEACRHVAAGLVPAVADGGDRAARAELSLGSLLAGLSMNLSDCGADHALGHAIGGRLGLPHGMSVGLVLAEALDVDRVACADRLERVADALCEPPDGSADGSRAVRAVRRILAGIGFPTCAQSGVTAAEVDALVELARDDYCLTVSPHTWTAGDIRRAYADALALDARGSSSNL